MKPFIQEFIISCDNAEKKHGKVYELIGLDVTYDSHLVKISSTHKSKILSVNEGIHVHTLNFDQTTLSDYFIEKDENQYFILKDYFGNKISVTVIDKSSRKSIGIITSGGDAPGMNAAIRSIVRAGIRRGAKVHGVYRGYDGLINDYICQLRWNTETHSSSEGGTVLLSFRSGTFYKKEVRKEAVFNLVKRGINCLIVLGGDGSLKGAMTLKKEFREHFRDLVQEGRLSEKELRNAKKTKSRIESFDDFYGKPECYKDMPKIDIKKFTSKKSVNKQNFDKEDNSVNKKDDSVIKSASYKDKDDPMVIKGRPINVKPVNISSNTHEEYIYDLQIIGIPASIDNDIYEADYTLGADTAMNRVVESIDHLSSTMRSHQRIFVIEVMGRTCGWLSLMSAFSCLADYVFIPEDPPYDWKSEVMSNIKFAKDHGKPGMFIIISEGAIDTQGNKIWSTDVVNFINSKEIDVRLLKLGHVQRGGPTSAFDRILGTISGIQAVEELYKEDDHSKVILFQGSDIKTCNLEEIIEINDKIKIKETNLDFKSVLNYRSCIFKIIHQLYRNLINEKRQSRALYMEDINLKLVVEKNMYLKNKFINKNKEIEEESDKDIRIGILQFGGRSSGMNTAMNSIIQYCYSKKVSPYIILNGFDGLLKDQVIKAQLFEFSNDFNNGGAILGVGNLSNLDAELIKRQLKKYNLKNLIIIGDSDCFSILSQLKNSSINIMLVPAASSNNIPYTDICVGSDTAINTIVKVSDCAKLSSFSMKKNVFVIEISGGHCGFLTQMAGIASGVFECFIPERKYLLSHLSETAHRLRNRFKNSQRTGTVIFRNEKTFCSIGTESFCRILKTDGDNLFDTDYSILGRLQQGINPSPLDRIHATLLGMKAVDFCLNKGGVGIVGVIGDTVVFTDINKCLQAFDMEKKVCHKPKWIKYNSVCKSLE